MHRNVYTAVAGLFAGWLAAGTALAQTFELNFLYGATAGAVSHVSIANLKTNWVVTGVRNGSGNLQVISWYSNGTQLVRKGSATAGAISSVATADLGSSRFVTAVLNGSGNLELIVWSVSSSGALTRQGDFGSTAAQTVDIARLSSSRVATAIKDSRGDLAINVWAVDSTGNITPEGSVTDVAVSKASITSMNSSQVVTAAQTSAGDLLLSSWSVDGSGNITHQDDASAGAIDQVEVTSWAANTGHVGTAVRNSSGDLKVIDWVVDPGTGVITWQTSLTVGPASKVAVSTIGTLIFTAVENSKGKLAEGVWGYGSGSTFEEAAKAVHNAASIVAAAPLQTSENFSVTASKNGSGDLELDVWQYVVIS